MNEWLAGWGDLVGIVAFVVGLAGVVWLNHVGKMRQRRLEQAERLRAIAWVGLGVPAVLAGGATVGTLLVLANTDPRLHIPVLCTIWGSIAIPSLVAAAMSLGILARRSGGESRKRDYLGRLASRGEAPAGARR
jgi:alkylation response protein AidB-like acyl-CoA dehydrogenase